MYELYNCNGLWTKWPRFETQQNFWDFCAFLFKVHKMSNAIQKLLLTLNLGTGCIRILISVH
jgi:hypothetical protein